MDDVTVGYLRLPLATERLAKFVPARWADRFVLLTDWLLRPLAGAAGGGIVISLSKRRADG